MFRNCVRGLWAGWFVCGLLGGLVCGLVGCARPVPPTGGPKDKTAPVLIKSIPATGSRNWKGKKIELFFNERVKGDNLLQHLIFSPPKEGFRFKTAFKKNRLELSFEEELDTAKTYVLSLFGGLGDVTEQNAVQNIQLAFSPGKNLDTHHIEGTVRWAENGVGVRGALVYLYHMEDSSLQASRVVGRSQDSVQAKEEGVGGEEDREEDKEVEKDNVISHFSEGQATYITRASAEGVFSFSYLPAGRYRLWGNLDANSNQRLDIDTEAHGFVGDTLVIGKEVPREEDATQRHWFMDLFEVDGRPVVLTGRGPRGKEFVLSYNKELVDFEVGYVDSSLVAGKSMSRLYGKLGAKARSLKLYPPKAWPSFSDSTLAYVWAIDKQENEVRDTFMLRFDSPVPKPPPAEKKKKKKKKSKEAEEVIDIPTSFSWLWESLGGGLYTDKPVFVRGVFPEPVREVHWEHLYLMGADSSRHPLDRTAFSLGKHALDFSGVLDGKTLASIQRDSTNKVNEDGDRGREEEEEEKGEGEGEKGVEVELVAEEGAFSDIFSVSSSKQSFVFTPADSKEYGEISGEVVGKVGQGALVLELVAGVPSAEASEEAPVIEAVARQALSGEGEGEGRGAFFVSL